VLAKAARFRFHGPPVSSRAAAQPCPPLPSPLVRALGAAALLWLPGACSRRVMNDVPTLGEEPCTVQRGEVRGNVLLRCGPPCGGGPVASGRCDVYGYVSVCYGADGRVAELSKLPARGGPFPWCNWQP
jgi:hypothetical protein